MAICGVCRWVLVVFGSTQQQKTPKKNTGVSRLVRVWGTKKKVAKKMNHADHQSGGQPPVRLAPSVYFFSSKNPPIRPPEVELALAGGRSWYNRTHVRPRIPTGAKFPQGLAMGPPSFVCALRVRSLLCSRFLVLGLKKRGKKRFCVKKFIQLYYRGGATKNNHFLGHFAHFGRAWP